MRRQDDMVKVLVTADRLRWDASPLTVTKSDPATACGDAAQRRHRAPSAQVGSYPPLISVRALAAIGWAVPSS